MAEFCGSSRTAGGKDRSAGPTRKYPVDVLFASISKCVQSRWTSANPGPLSSSSTSRPRAASSFATTAPPPPAPTTITSRISASSVWTTSGPCRAVMTKVPLEIVPPVGDPVVAREAPSNRLLGHRPRHGIEDGCLGVGNERHHGRQDPGEGLERLEPFHHGQNRGLLGEGES